MDFWACPRCGSANTTERERCYGCGLRRGGARSGSRTPLLFLGTGVVVVLTAVAFAAGTLIGQVPIASPTLSPAALVADASPSAPPSIGAPPTTTPTPSSGSGTPSPSREPTTSPTPTPRPTHSGGSSIATNVKVVKSTNWAGYGLLNGQFTDVSAEWTEPEVDCSQGVGSYVSFWVGLDGVTSNSVEQIGTAAECDTASGPPLQYAWYELYPTPEKQTPLVSVRAGDHFVATVHGVTTRAFQLTLTNTTTGQTFSSLQGRLGNWPTSAEWVVEPTAICKQSCVTQTLARFSDVTFTNVSAGTLDGPVALGDATDLYRFDIRAKHAGKLADVSSLSLDEPSFGVQFLGH